ncbi:DUF1616 domain-containing protein [Actinoplanes oblitus]|uniref:DUF1616 domain-containing protein n=1 Tax=Actinoplanes oblitus TaxID=3040509 RepID=A0ABY8WMR1_9ACTN|nr:DUF1616 domain-containing protein [Actinoplanes oblitus]WIM99174.1 DUF1616 domain-containing protein [Actinoplanes oblitus]
MNAVRAGVLTGLTVVSGAAVLLGPLPVSAPAGLLLSLVLPGAALVGALFRRDRPDDLGGVERLVLIPALSLATLVLGGLLLWAVGGTLNRVGWLGLSAATTLVAVAVAVARQRWGAPAGDRPEPAGDGPAARRPRLTRPRLVHEVLPLVFVVALLAGFGWYSFRDSERTYNMAVVSLSAAPPGPVAADGNRAVRLSVTGLTGAGPYTLVATDSVGEQIDRRKVEADARGSWSATVKYPADQRVTVKLLTGTPARAYRELVIAAAAAARR